MTSTQPQNARSSDVATSLVFSVQGRVVERSTSRGRPEVFVAIPGMYPGCRVNLAELNKHVHCHLARACSEQHQRPVGEKILLRSRTILALSGKCFRNRCMPAPAAAGSAACSSRLFFSIGYAVSTTTWCRSFPFRMLPLETSRTVFNTTWNGDMYVLY